MTAPTRNTFLYGPQERADRDYWQARLTGRGDPGTLPTDRQRSSVVVKEQPSLDFEVPAATGEAVLALTGGSQLLTLAVVASGVVACLRRYGAAGRVVLGTPTSGAAEPQLLPVVVGPDEGGTFRELLTAVRGRLADGYAHQGLPIDRVRPQPDEKDTAPAGPLFHVRVEIDGHADEVAPAGNDVSLRIALTPDGISGSVSYNRRLLDEEAVRRFTGHLTTVLAAGIAEPTVPVGRLDILTGQEREQLAALASPLPAARPDAATVHELVVAQAGRTPDAAAVIDGATVVSYRQLHESARRIAARLTGAGVRPGDVVALHSQRSHEAIVGAVGVLLSGAAYLPMDPDLGSARLLAMIASAGVRVVLSAVPGAELGDTEVLAICGPAAPPAAAAPEVSGESPAYVMFTSGSTGVPKGIEMPHRALVNLLAWQHEQSTEAGSTGATLIRTPLWFDVSFQEIFATLCFGGTAVIAEPGLERDPQALLKLMSEHTVQRAFLPFVALQQLAMECSRGRVRLPDLKEMITAGEQLKISPPLVDFFRAHPDCTLRNHYGPTETHVVTSYTLRGRPTRWPVLPPIGRPVDGVSAHIVDELLRPVPLGVTGQLGFSGVQLANGYRGDPALTEERFLAGRPEPGERLYLTGDLARRRADGDIEFQGRADRQLKIRGHRVEPGEIESALMLHHAIEQAVVVGLAEDDGRTHLAAYVVPTPAYSSEADLRQHLADRLPSYQIPRTITVLESLPLTSTGKVDAASLPEPGAPSPVGGAIAGPPRNELEAELAAIWCRVLRVEQVGIFDHFLELGGDSIIATQAVAAANDQGLDISMKDFFAHPTIAELAAIVPAGPLRRTEREDDHRSAPLTPVQWWFSELALPSRDHWNIGVLLRPAERLDHDLVERTLLRLVERHEALATTFTGGDHASEPLAPAAAVRLSEVTAPQAEADLDAFVTEVAQRTHREIRVTEGPMVAAAIVRTPGDAPDRLLIVIHHLVVDGVSWRILLDEFQTVYRALADGKPVALPPRTSSYQTWAHGLAEFAGSPAAEEELAHWSAVPAGPVEPLPSKGAGPGTEATSRRIETAFSPQESHLLLRELPGTYHARIEEILLAGLFEGFRAWTGQTSLLVEFEGHGRESILPDVDLTRTVGWFSTMYPVELRVPDAGEATGAGVLVSVKEALRAVPNKGIGYGVLRYLSPSPQTRRALAERPAPQVKFNYLGQFDAQFGTASMFTPADEPTGPMIAPDGERPLPLYVQGHVVDSRLHFFVEYSDGCHDEAQMRSVIDRFKQYLLHLVDNRDRVDSGSLTRSDFPAATLGGDELDTLLGQIESEETGSK